MAGRAAEPFSAAVELSISGEPRWSTVGVALADTGASLNGVVDGVVVVGAGSIFWEADVGLARGPAVSSPVVVIATMRCSNFGCGTGSGSATCFPLAIVVRFTVGCCCSAEEGCPFAQASLELRTKTKRHKTSAKSRVRGFRLRG